jgi:hypothetical protein
MVQILGVSERVCGERRRKECWMSKREKEEERERRRG